MEVLFNYLGNEKYVIMEISSISFFEYRLFGIKFDYIILSNLYEDHLDYHKTVLDYHYSKYLILATNPSATAIINDEIADKRVFRLNEKTYLYGFNNNTFKVKSTDNSLFVSSTKETIEINVCFLPVFFIKNILAAITLLFLLGNDLKKIQPFFNNIPRIPGRYEIFKYQNKTIILDYPHTAAAYETLFKDVDKLYKGNYLVVFGAGGNRQKDKRKTYGEIVSKYAKYAIITNDNPRDESEESIICDICEGISIPYEIEYDRKKALTRAFTLLKNYNVLLVLGKGVEEYIVKNNKKHLYSDYETIKELIM